MWPPYNLRMVMRGLFCRETVRHPSTVGSFRKPRVNVKAAAAATSLGHAMCSRPPLLWMGVRVGMDPSIPWCRHSGDNSCGVSHDKARVCGLWDAHPIVVVAQRPINWRLASCATQHGVCVCWHGGPTPHGLLQNQHLCVHLAVSASLAAAPAADSPVSPQQTV